MIMEVDPEALSHSAGGGYQQRTHNENTNNTSTTLSPEEWNRLNELDSRCFGFLNLAQSGNAKDRLLVFKAIRVYEKQVLEAKKPEGDSTGGEDARTYLKLGHLHLLAQDFPKALSAYQRVYKLDAENTFWKDPCYLYGIGLVYHHFRAYEMASEAFRQVLYVSPCFQRVGEIHLRLGLINKALEDWELALKFLNCALVDCSPCTLGKPDIRYHIAHCYDCSGDSTRAKEAYETLYTQLSQDQQLYLKASIARQLGWILYREAESGPPAEKLRKLQLALSWLHESLKNDSTSAQSGRTYYYLGRCHAAYPGKAHEAFVNYRHSIDRSEASADTWCSIGVLYQQQQQPMDALQAFVCAVQLDSANGAAWTDLALLYQSVGQFSDALACLRKAALFKPVNPDALRQRIRLLETELERNPLLGHLSGKLTANSKPLPPLDEAWKLPIPAELAQRQDSSLRQKQELYLRGGPLLGGAVGGVDGAAAGPLDGHEATGKLPPFWLNTQQIQLMHVLQQNQNHLDDDQRRLLARFQQNYHQMQQHKAATAYGPSATMQQPPSQQQQAPTRIGMHATAQPTLLKSEPDPSAGQQQVEELPQVSHEDIMNILGSGKHGDFTKDEANPPALRRASNETDDLLGSLGDSHGSGSGAGGLGGGATSGANSTAGSSSMPSGANNNDPMLGSAALEDTKDSSREVSQDGCLPTTGAQKHRTRVQDSCVTSSTDPLAKQRLLLGQQMSDGYSNPADEPLPPPVLNLMSKVHAPVSISSAELLERVRFRCTEPCRYKAIFDEQCAPPKLPTVPQDKRPAKTQLLLPTPSVVVDSRKDAFSVELQQFCYATPVALVKGLTTALKMDLALFSTKSLLETAPEHEVEVRTQLQMSPDTNMDQFGQKRWYCESFRGFTTVQKYAQYQAQSFQHSLKEEQEKLLKKPSNVHGEYEPYGKRRKDDVAYSDEVKMLKFGTNIDLSDEKLWRAQLQEINRLPAFSRLVSGCNMLSHLGHTVYGMNTVQLYMKVPGSRTPGHTENNNFPSVNINIGPGECEWFSVPFEYLGEINKLLEKRKLSFLKGSWWPLLTDLWENDIPVYRFTQKAGDLVWVGSGCVHWVQATGWCNNIAWNVAPITAHQFRLTVFSHEWNRLQAYKSIVPLQHMSWQLANNIRFTQPKLFEMIKQMLIRSLAYQQMCLDFAAAHGKTAKFHSRLKGDPAHYCADCEIEVFNVLWVSEQGNKFVVRCVDCARRMDAQLKSFTVLIQQQLEQLAAIFDATTLYPAKDGVLP